MRQVVPAIALLLGLVASSPASAAPPTVDLSNLPGRCRPVAQIPRSAEIAEPAFAARMSAASCTADGALANVSLVDNDATIQALDNAAAPSLATLDEVIAHGDARSKFVALYTKADLLFGLQTRMRNSIPPISATTSLDGAREIEQRHTALEPKLERWNTQATQALQSAAEIARANPDLVREDPVVQLMLLRTQAQLEPTPTPAVAPSTK